MTEEQKRYQYSCELGEYLDTAKNTDPNETVYMSVADVLNDLNNHSSRVKELEELNKKLAFNLGSLESLLDSRRDRIVELEAAIEAAFDNITCDASWGALHPLIELMEGK